MSAAARATRALAGTLHRDTTFNRFLPLCRNSFMLKLEFVPAAGDKLVLKLSPPPPPLADKQACACAHVTMRSHLQDVSSGLLAALSNY